MGGVHPCCGSVRMSHGTLGTLLGHVQRIAGADLADGLTDRQLLERFTSRREPAALAALVRRHGRLVLAACRQVLTESADVEDAFQATFLVLLRKANSVDWQASLGGWLYAVAHRIAVRSRDAAARRRRLTPLAARPAAAPPPDLSWPEAVAVLHEELDRLPDRYRRVPCSAWAPPDCATAAPSAARPCPATVGSWPPRRGILSPCGTFRVAN